MGLRHILMVLSLLAFLSATAGGVLYYSALRQAAFTEAEQGAATRTQLIHKSITSFLSEHHNTVVALAGLPALQEALLVDTATALYRVNVTLDHFTTTLKADVCYLMDRDGITIASSNRRDADSFVGQNFGFRPYFQQAIQGGHGTYLALGVTSGKRGVYHAYPVYSDPEDRPVGVAVIKSSIEVIEHELGLPADDIVLVTNEEGVIFISNRTEWLYQLAWELSPEQLRALRETRQFGPGPWQWIGLQRNGDHVIDRQGQRYLIHEADIDRFSGWSLLYLRNTRAISQSVSGPLMSIVRPAALLLSILIGLSVLVLYQKASREIMRRRSAEHALRQSELRYRSLYHHTPAMLHSIDPQGNLLSVSDFWIETTGYSREEALGRPLTDFLAPESRMYAAAVSMPQFFEYGYVKDVPYKLIKKNGEVIDILLSAIADRGPDGNIQRSLAVSIDVTERNQAEAALRIAKEELSRYSKALEQQVRERTSEITAILQYTPAVVYMKDTEGRYLLVNSRFEKLFGVVAEAVRGRTDAEVLPDQVARQFSTHDELVLTAGDSLHVEEHIPLPEGSHTYLSVKFPIYDKTSGRIQGVCGISTDITALKKAQEQLRQLSGSIMANQEKERALIARELHDELGQLLTALRMDAVWLQQHLKNTDAPAAERARAICSLVDTTIEEVRAMAIRLRPGVLDDLGLVEALDWYTTEFERRAEIACIFNHGAIPPVDDATATAAYRITQEALTNVARHAQASRAEVDLRMVRNDLVLAVRDDGRGFNPETLSDTQMLGLAGMRERAVLAGGRLEVDSRPGRGTAVRFQVPLNRSFGSSL